MEKELLESRRKLQHAEETTMTLQVDFVFPLTNTKIVLQQYWGLFLFFFPFFFTELSFIQRRMAFVEEEEKRQVREEDESKAALEKKIKSLITRGMGKENMDGAKKNGSSCAENKLIRSVAEIQFFNENEEVPALISKLKVLMEELNHSQHSLQVRKSNWSV